MGGYGVGEKREGREGGGGGKKEKEGKWKKEKEKEKEEREMAEISATTAAVSGMRAATSGRTMHAERGEIEGMGQWLGSGVGSVFREIGRKNDLSSMMTIILKHFSA